MNRTQTVSATLTAAAALGIGAGILLHNSGGSNAANGRAAVTASVPPTVPATTTQSPSMTNAASTAPAPTTAAPTPTSLPNGAPATQKVVPPAKKTSTLTADVLLTPSEYQDGRLTPPERITPFVGRGSEPIISCQDRDPGDDPGVTGVVEGHGGDATVSMGQLVFDTNSAAAFDRELAAIDGWRNCTEYLAQTKGSLKVHDIQQVNLGEKWVAKYWQMHFTFTDGSSRRYVIGYVHDGQRISVLAIDGTDRALNYIQMPTLLRTAQNRLG